MKSIRGGIVLLALVLVVLAEDAAAGSSSSLWEVIGEKMTGLAGSVASPHVVGGNVVAPNSFPHQVKLEISVKPGWASWCGGSLISPEWVLTAAHCVIDKMGVDVVLGVHDVTKNELTRQKIHVSRVIIEETYPASDKDIALLKLTHPATLNAFVQPIRLPRASGKSDSLTGRPVTIIGWGRMIDHPPADSPNLRFVDTTVLERGECTRQYNPERITDWRICSNGAGGKGACVGDSGGPLLLTENDGQRTLIGITSFVISPCTAGDASVFTRVDHWLEWINKHTGIPIRA